MRLINHQQIVFAETRVTTCLGKENTIGHQFDRRVVAGDFLKTHLVAHQLSQRLPQLLGDTLRDRARGKTARLCVSDALR